MECACYFGFQNTYQVNNEYGRGGHSWLGVSVRFRTELYVRPLVIKVGGPWTWPNPAHGVVVSRETFGLSFREFLQRGSRREL